MTQEPEIQEENWQQELIYVRLDGSYIITYRTYPYHIPQGMSNLITTWEEVNTFDLANPGYVQPEPIQELPEPQPEPELTFEQKLAQIDRETSRAILSGFNFMVSDVLYHFSYDTLDQQNFADAANAATLAKIGVSGLPQTVIWNGWLLDTSTRELVRLEFDLDEFLILYLQGALVHKATQMEIGSQKKEALYLEQTNVAQQA